MTKIIIFEGEDKIILPKCGGDVAPISLEVLLLEMLGNVNIGCFQTPGPEIDELVRYVCRTEDNLSLRRLDLFIANNEQGISLTDDENLVIGVPVQFGTMPYNIGREEYDRRIGAKSLAFDAPRPGIITPRPFFSFQDNGLFRQNGSPGFSRHWNFDPAVGISRLGTEGQILTRPERFNNPIRTKGKSVVMRMAMNAMAMPRPTEPCSN
ncbi:Uncharacterised protein [Brucella anthropi]|nr:Uncharacterised protein [Brucella anthropi]